MSIEKFLNIIRMQSSMQANSRASSAVGVVIAYDQNNYFVNCELYPNPDNPDQPTTTGWIPLGSPFIGNGWGMLCPPNIGDVILIEYQEGSFQNGIATMRFFQLGQNLSVPGGEYWLVHQSGSYIKMTNDGNVSIFSTVEIDVSAAVVNIGAAEGSTIKLGNLGATLTGMLTGAAMAIYNAHTHPQAGGGTTGIPIEQMSDDDVTSNVTAN